MSERDRDEPNTEYTMYPDHQVGELGSRLAEVDTTDGAVSAAYCKDRDRVGRLPEPADRCLVNSF